MDRRIKGTDSRKAELQAVKRVYPGDKNSSTTLRIWREYGLWPPSEEILSSKNAGAVGETRNQGKNGLKVIAGGGTKNLKSLKEHSERGRPESELSERVVLQGATKILDTIEVHHREWTGVRNRKYSTFKTRVIAGRLPIEVINEINRLKGSKTFHLERALSLYLMVMKETA